MTASPPHQISRRRRVTRRRLLAAVAALALVRGLVGGVLDAPARAAEPSGLVEIGVLEAAGEATGGPPHDPPPLLVAEGENLGFAVGVADSKTQVTMYDLERLRTLASVQSFEISQLRASQVSAFGLDEAGRRLYFPNRPAPGTSAVCPEDSPSAFVNDFSVLPTLRYDADVSAGEGSMEIERLYMTCAGNRAVANHALTVYEVDGGKKLLAVGTYLDEGYRYPLPDADLIDNLGQSLIVRQFDLEKLNASTSPLDADPSALEWEIDLRSAGCGRWDSPETSLFVERVGDSVVTLCSDPRPVLESSVGAQGYVVTIPLDEHDAPLTVEGAERAPDPANPANDAYVANAVVRRTPSLPGTVFPFFDPASQRLLLLTADDANGNAAWVFDPTDERFIGVMTGGVVGQAANRTAAGFDRRSGRAYLLTERGVLAASVRPSPLPGGRIYPVAAERITYPGIAIGVAPRLRRLFVPVVGQGGWTVIEDRIPEPPASVAADPDSFTTQVDEQPGVTDVNSSGAAIASGAHLVAVGGAPRIANQLDPLCHSPHPAVDVIHNNVNETDLFAGSCAADQVVTRGNRSLLLAPSTIGASLDSGASAESAGLAFPENDQATDGDVKELGWCGYGYVERLQRPFTWFSRQDEDPDNDHTPQSPRTQDGGFCDSLQRGLFQATGDDLRTGTRGGEYPRQPGENGKPAPPPAPGRGFPVPATSCSNFGSEPSADTFGDDAHDRPKDAAVSSAVTCDPSRAGATARSSAHGFAYPDAGAALVGVGNAWTDTATLKTPDGQTTVATAVAQGVRVGPLTVGELRAVAVSRARGRTGTASVELTRLWCRVAVEGIDDFAPGESGLEDGVVAPGCVDPDEHQATRDLLDRLNQALGRIRLSVPAASTEATPGGYQAVVTKDPRVRAADQAVNDDDSHTVPALQAVVYNDGPEGRNRVVAQFAGVHTEARYGVVVLSSFDVPDFPALDLPAAFDDLFTAPTVAAATTRAVAEVTPVANVAAGPPRNPLAEFFNAPVQALQALLGWLVNNPAEAALLFMLLSLLAAPIYLTLRARAAARALEP